MDLQLFFSTVLKYRRLIAIGALLGLIVLTLTAYSISFQFDSIYQWPFLVSPRNNASYESNINLAIDSPKFGMGRAGVAPGSWQGFDRSVSLAPTYSYIISSDFIRKRVEARIGNLKNSEQITSEPIQDTPLFHVKVQGIEPQRVKMISIVAIDELQNYVKQNQSQEKTPVDDRISIRELGLPDGPKQASSFYSLKLLVGFLSPIFLALIMAFMIENIEGPPDQRGQSGVSRRVATKRAS